METKNIGAKIRTMVERGKQRVQKAVGKKADKAPPKTVQKAAPRATRSTKKPHPGTDPRQPDDRDGNEGFHLANPPTPIEPVRKKPRRASLNKASPRNASTPRSTSPRSNASTRSNASPRSTASTRKASPRKASPNNASPGAKRPKTM